MKKIRKGVFETNSSSTHSLVLDMHGPLMETPFPHNASGVVSIYPGEYGWDIEEFRDPLSKLSYLYTDAMRPYDEPDPQINEKLQMIVDAVREHTGLDVVFERYDCEFFPFGYIDHQSVGLCDEVWKYGVEGVKQFAFSPNSWFKTDNDNY